MMDYGVSETGFTLKTYDEILSDLSASAQTYFGYSVDTSVNTPLGQFLRTTAVEIAQLWEQLEKTYYSGFINTAEGVNLDRICALAGVKRRAALRATGVVTFSVSSVPSSAITIPAGVRVSLSDESITFCTTETGIIGTSATSVDVSARAELYGPEGNVAAHTISKIISSGYPSVSVTNASVFTGGGQAESDADFRYRVMTMKPVAKGTCTALMSAILALDGVTDVNITEDTTNHTVSIAVSGGDSSEITAVIEATRPAGIAVTWSMATGVSVSVTAAVSVITGANASSVAGAVEAAVIAWLSSHKIGDSLSFTKLFGVVMGVEGVSDITSLSMSDGTNTADAVGESIIVDSDTIVSAGTVTVTTS